MSATSSALWIAAVNALSEEDRTLLPKEVHDGDKPDAVLTFVDRQRDLAGEKPVKLGNGANFFPRDALSKVSRGVKRFIEVGDTVVQYDPGHAALPWAALRLALQMSINSVERHAAVIEGIDEIIRYLVWGRVVEKYFLPIPYEGHVQLEENIVSLYQHMLVCFAHIHRYLGHKTPLTRVKNALKSDSEFREPLRAISKWQNVIDKQTQQISGKLTIEHGIDSRELRKAVDELQGPIERTEILTHAVLSAVERAEKDRILDWASGIPYERHFNMARKIALKGTGNWLLNHPEYRIWRNCSVSQILWLHGSAGSGKSTILSIVLDSLMREHESHQEPYPMYFYCSRTTAEPERRDHDQILRSLVRQASDLPGGPPLHHALRTRYAKSRTAGHIDGDEAVELLIQIIHDRPITYIFVDALDECEPDTRNALIESLKKILTDSSRLVKIFLTSRDGRPDLDDALEDYPEVHIDASSNQADVELYVREKVGEAVRKRRLLPGTRTSEVPQSQIEKSLCEGAQGMFRWVALQLQYLCTFTLKTALLERLGKLPRELGKIYKELYVSNMQKLDAHEVVITQLILSLLLIAQRQLRTGELLKLVSSRDESVSRETALILCFDLITIDTEQDQFRFAHLSVREFLEDHSDEFSIIALHQRVLTASIESMINTDTCQPREYAVQCWPTHAEKLSNAGVNLADDLILSTFLSGHSLTFHRWNDCLLEYRFRTEPPDLSFYEMLPRLDEVSLEKPHPILVMASFNLHRALQDLLRTGDTRHIVDMKHGKGHNALHLASKYGHVRCAETLLKAGADINAKGGRYGTALHYACQEGNEAVVRLLLDAGAEVNAQGGIYGNALQAACFEGSKAIVHLLLDAGAEVNAQGGEYGTALQAACIKGSEAIVRLLLEAGADVNAQGGYYGNALQAACIKGSEAIVRLLLDAGADVNAQGGNYGIPLQVACFKGSETIVHLLLEAGADVNAQGGKYSTALQAACFEGSEAIVHLLLDAGAEVNAQGGYYGNALQAACSQENAGIVRLLLDAGADVHARGRYQGGALQIACKRGNEAIVRLLLEARAYLWPQDTRTGLQDAFHRTDISWAGIRGGLIAVKILLNLKKDGLRPTSIQAFEQKDALGCSMIHHAAMGGWVEGVAEVLKVNPQVDICDTQGWTPLHWSAWRGHTGVVELLLQNNCDANLQDAQGWTAREVARFAGHSHVVEQLLMSRVPENFVPRATCLDGFACDCCNMILSGFQYRCQSCENFDLCFRCIRDVHKFHPGHEFIGLYDMEDFEGNNIRLEDVKMLDFLRKLGPQVIEYVETTSETRREMIELRREKLSKAGDTGRSGAETDGDRVITEISDKLLEL